MSEKPSSDDLALWRRLVETERMFYGIRAELFSKCRSTLVDMVRSSLSDPVDLLTALGIAALLTVGERQELFESLVPLASVSHPQLGKVRALILSLPRDWVLANIEPTAEPLLRDGTDEEYRRLLELYSELDRDLMLRLARRAAQHPDIDIREAGEDFLQKTRR